MPEQRTDSCEREGGGGGAAVAQRKTNLMILPVKEGFLTLLPLGLAAQTWQWVI